MTAAPFPSKESTSSGSSAARSLARQTSVIVVAYNSGNYLRDCIASIYVTQPEVEIILVDNASYDGAADRVKAEFPSIRLLRSEENRGFGAGNNLGAVHAQRAFLVFVNPDAVVTEGWLEALVCPLAEEKSIGLVTPKVLLRNAPDHINVAGLDVHLSGVSTCRGLGSPRIALNTATEVAAVSGSAFAVRREVFQAVGGFDEDFFLYVEDVDLSVRVWLAGYRCLYVPRAVVRHEYELKVDARKTFYVERGRYLMLLKVFSRRTLLALLPTLLLTEVITWGWVLWRNPKAALHKLEAWRWILAHWAQIVEKRRQVQASRVRSDWVFLSLCQWRLEFGQVAGPRVAQGAAIVFGPFLWGASHVARLVMGS